MLQSQHTAELELRRADKTYSLCAAPCRDVFEADPEKHLSCPRERCTKTTHIRRY